MTFTLLAVVVAALVLLVLLVVVKRKAGSRPGHDAETDEQRLAKLRNVQRAEKVREAREDLERTHRSEREPARELDDQERRLRDLRAFQRAEKQREAAEQTMAERLADQAPEPSIESLITREVVDLRRQEELHQEAVDKAEVSRVVGEARDLIIDLNAQFGWEPGEPSIADRMFNTDVETVLGTAISKGKVDVRTRAMVASMRHFARASTGGRNELAEVMAARVLLGAARMTNEESESLVVAKQLFGDNFAEAAGYADRISRAEEVTIAKRLGMHVNQERDSMSWSIADERDKFS